MNRYKLGMYLYQGKSTLCSPTLPYLGVLLNWSSPNHTPGCAHLTGILPAILQICDDGNRSWKLGGAENISCIASFKNCGHYSW